MGGQGSTLLGKRSGLQVKNEAFVLCAGRLLEVFEVRNPLIKVIFCVQDGWKQEAETIHGNQYIKIEACGLLTNCFKHCQRHKQDSYLTSAGFQSNNDIIKQGIHDKYVEDVVQLITQNKDLWEKFLPGLCIRNYFISDQWFCFQSPGLQIV